jgi:hypothetical protein
MSQSMVVTLVVLGALVALLVVAAVLALRDPAASRRRVEALFRKPRKPPQPPGPDHYYRPYWS